MHAHNSHILYTAKDFTKEEVQRDNVIARKVLKEGHGICKMCGVEGKKSELAKRCKAAKGK